MFYRIRIAVGAAVLIAFLTYIIASAKGGFSFIDITGGNLKASLRVTDPDLTTDFFAFADFSQRKTKVPANPGTGYEITRYYVDGTDETPFDRLHYYPETGFVYYDGMMNGSSEYDGNWYLANPEIKAAFEGALSSQIKSVAPNAPQRVPALKQAQADTPNLQSQRILLSVIAAGVVVILLLASRSRKNHTR